MHEVISLFSSWDNKQQPTCQCIAGTAAGFGRRQIRWKVHGWIHTAGQPLWSRALPPCDTITYHNMWDCIKMTNSRYRAGQVRQQGGAGFSTITSQQEGCGFDSQGWGHGTPLWSGWSLHVLPMSVRVLSGFSILLHSPKTHTEAWLTAPNCL